MKLPQLRPELALRLGAGIAPVSSPPALGAVLNQVEAIMDYWPKPNGVYRELRQLASFIEDTRTEIAALRPDEVKQQYLPTAADELDAIVAATAQATNTIMDAVELVERTIPSAGEAGGAALSDAVTRIYEACTFQDITGQRITKVVKVLKVIEERIDKLLIAVGGPEGLAPVAREGLPETAQLSVDAFLAATTAEGANDASLLNGPALPGNASTQDEIDALLADMG